MSTDEQAFERAAAEAEAKKRAAENDARAKAGERDRKADKNATPTQVDGGEKPDADAGQEFQKQKAEKHFRIVIPSSNDPTEVRRVPIGVNGVFYTIVRDEEVVVPACVLEQLNNATETRYRKGPARNDGSHEMVAYEAKSYVYQNLGEAKPTAIK